MKKHTLGNWGVAALVIINLLIWLFFTPRGSPHPQQALEILGEVLSTSALVLFACVLVLANKPSLLEPYFGGLDKMYVAHKNIAILGMILIVFHELWVPKTGLQGPGLWAGQVAFVGILGVIILTVGPRVPFLSRLTQSTYSGWLKIHRLVGIFFIFGVIHIPMVEPMMAFSPVLSIYVYTIAGIGILAYLYKEFLWVRLLRHHPHKVQAVNKLNKSTTEVVLAPQETKLAYHAGQFLFIWFDGDAVLAEPHPFTISSAPKQGSLHLSIKTSGDWTAHLQAHLQPGTQAYVYGPYGMLNYKTGAAQQIWLAGGIGITPFLSWMRDFDGTSPQQIDFFYTVNAPSEALYLNEIEQAAAINKNFRTHISYSSEDGRLSAQKIVETSGAVAGKDVYMCGPYNMVLAFRNAFTQMGLATENIHYEEFNFR